MKIIPVYLRDMQDAKHLVQAAEACKKEVDLLCGRYVVVCLRGDKDPRYFTTQADALRTLCGGCKINAGCV